MKSTLFNMVAVLFTITLIASAGVGAVNMLTEDAIAELAMQAEKKGTGARGLRSIMESLMLEVMYQLPSPGISKCVVDGAAVRGESPVKLSGSGASPRKSRSKKA